LRYLKQRHEPVVDHSLWPAPPVRPQPYFPAL
jgi:hypothetical protein